MSEVLDFKTLPPPACSCEKCQSLCRNNPGWFTPEEAERAIAAGLANRLMLDYLVGRAENDYARIWVLAPASAGCEGREAPDLWEMMRSFTFGKGRCVFLSDEGLCGMHNTNYKPLQCRLAMGCEDCEATCPDNTQMAAYWDNDHGRKVVARWKELVNHEH